MPEPSKPKTDRKSVLDLASIRYLEILAKQKTHGSGVAEVMTALIEQGVKKAIDVGKIASKLQEIAAMLEDEVIFIRAEAGDIDLVTNETLCICADLLRRRATYIVDDPPRVSDEAPN